MTFALTHLPSSRMDACVRTHIEVQPIDGALALRQHEAYRAMLARCGAQVTVLDANRTMPDCVFVEDTAIVLDEIAIITSMGTSSRRAEPAAIEAELGKYRSIVRVSLPATIEGGDVLRVGRRLLVGATSRTNAAGIAALAELTRGHGYQVTPVPVTGCLHLKTACTALPDGSLLVNPAWVDRGALTALGFDVVTVHAAEPNAANVALVGEHVCTGTGHPGTAEIMEQRGFKVVSVDLSEFAKAEGCTTCMSLLFT